MVRKKNLGWYGHGERKGKRVHWEKLKDYRYKIEDRLGDLRKQEKNIEDLIMVNINRELAMDSREGHHQPSHPIV